MYAYSTVSRKTAPHTPRAPRAPRAVRAVCATKHRTARTARNETPHRHRTAHTARTALTDASQRVIDGDMQQRRPIRLYLFIICRDEGSCILFPLLRLVSLSSWLAFKQR